MPPVPQERAALEKQAVEIIESKAAFEKEKQQMTAIGVADNDVLELNVGGTQFAAKRATLTQVDHKAYASTCILSLFEQTQLNLKSESAQHVSTRTKPSCCSGLLSSGGRISSCSHVQRAMGAVS